MLFALIMRLGAKIPWTPPDLGHNFRISNQNNSLMCDFHKQKNWFHQPNKKFLRVYSTETYKQ